MSATLASKASPPLEAPEEPELTDGFHLVIDALKLNGIEHDLRRCPASRSPISARMAQAEGMRVISFRHEQNAGNAAAIAGFLTQEARHLPDGVGAGLPERPDRARQRHHQLLPDDPDLAARASARSSTCSRATTRRWTSSPSPSRCARRPSACCMPRTSASAWRARSAPRCPAGPAASTSTCRPSCSRRCMDAEAGRKSLVKVVDPAPAQIPGARRGAARARRAEERQAAADHPRQGRGLRAGRRRDPRARREERHPLPADVHGQGPAARHAPQSAGAARSYVLQEADVVLLIGARLNWLLSHGKGKTWGGSQGLEEVHPDRHRAAARWTATSRSPRRWSATSAPASRALLAGIGDELAGAAGRLDRRHRRAQGRSQHRQDGDDAGEEPVADGLPQRAQRAARRSIKERPGRDPGQRGRQHARLRPRHHRHVPAAQAPRRRHLGHHGHRHGLRGRRRDRDRQAGARGRGRQRLRLLRHGGRDDLPLQPAGLRRRVQQQRHLPRHRRQPAGGATSRRPCSSRTRATTR